MVIRRFIRQMAVCAALAGLLAALATPASAYFPPSTHASASMVLGQSNMTSNGQATTQTGMQHPDRLGIDPGTKKVFVADSLNNRVLRFASVDALTDGASAEMVLGQTDFTHATAACSLTGMSAPTSVALDTAGRLWVSDSLCNRVLRFDNASLKTDGAAADGVLGQTNFTNHGAATSATRMWWPLDARADSAGRLWVADSNNNRVLRFDQAASKANGAAANGVLGQTDFVSHVQAITSTGMNHPNGVTVDAAGRLWVSDGINNRVLRFDNAAAKINGSRASAVLGQPDFTSGAPFRTRSGMRDPQAVAIDNSSGALYVADEGNNRVLVYSDAAHLANGANASAVLGQPDFTTGDQNTGGLSAASMWHPDGVYYDPATRILWVADTYNNRVLRFGRPSLFFSARSDAANDGWVLESTETSGIGGSMLATGPLFAGDDAANRQYRSILSFDTSGLDDSGITIRSVLITMRRAGVVGRDPYTTFGRLWADVANGTFGTAALETSDFKAGAAASGVGKFTPIGAGWYQLMLPASTFQYISRTGITQLRVRFAADDNNNHAANYDYFYPGDAATISNRPGIQVEYTIP